MSEKQSGQLLYEGKAKRIYSSGKPHELRVEFKNSLTAFNALKKGSFDNKGEVNRNIASLLFKELKKAGVDSHWIADQGPVDMIVHEVKIIPLEVVVRNILAGSTAKKLGLAEGKTLAQPLVEFYFKNDELADPFVSDDQILMLGVASESEIKELKSNALKVNAILQKVFAAIQIDLVDFKIEFGKSVQGRILLADEITPDCCRLWDQKTQEKLDKDRFRRDLGNVKESYEEVLSRLKARFA
jgi:phosphoribosylaminoimidazole-succinocarboxamide synthase